MIKLSNLQHVKGIRDFLLSKNIIIDDTSTRNLLMLGVWYYILSGKNKNEKKVYFFSTSHPANNPIPENEDACAFYVYVSSTYDKKDSFPLLSSYLSNKLHKKVVVHQELNKSVSQITTVINAVCTLADWPEVLKTTIVNLVTLYPKFFPEQIKLSKENIELIKKCENITKDASTMWENFCNLAFEELYDEEFKEVVENETKKMLSACMSYNYEKRLHAIKNVIEETIETCNNLMIRYNQVVEQYNNATAKYEALLMNGCDDSTEILYEVLFNSDKITVDDINDNHIIYRVSSVLNVFDEDAYKIKTQSKELDKISVLYDIPQDKKKDVLLFLNAVFVDRKYKIRTFNYFKLSLDKQSSLSVKRGAIHVENACLSHPHGQMFGCTGNFPTQWNEALASGDLVVAIQYTISYTAHINWGDFTVCKQMVNQIWTFRNDKFIEDENGEIITPLEAIKREKERVKDE